MLRKLLIPFSWIYYCIMWCRNFMYDHNILKSHEFDVPVISIGNITVGGTGKTPHTEYIVNLLKDMFKVTILSRGYKRSTSGYIKASDGSTVSDIGDKPKQMYRKFRGQADMTVCEDRAKGIAEILKEHNENQLIVLDDAYQHRSVTPRVNILLVDYNRPIFEDHLLPWGQMRESMKESHRANIVIVTKCPPDLKPIERRVFSSHLDILPSQSIYFTRFEYQELRPVFQLMAEDSIPISADSKNTATISADSKDMNILLVTGIANTKVLEEYVQTKYSKKITHLKYNDHYKFKQKDIDRIEQTFAGMPGPKLIITTEKDAMRLNEMEFKDRQTMESMYYLPIEVSFVFDDQDNLKTQLLKYVAENKGDYRLHTTVRQF